MYLQDFKPSCFASMLVFMAVLPRGYWKKPWQKGNERNNRKEKKERRGLERRRKERKKGTEGNRKEKGKNWKGRKEKQPQSKSNKRVQFENLFIQNNILIQTKLAHSPILFWGGIHHTTHIKRSMVRSWCCFPSLPFGPGQLDLFFHRKCGESLRMGQCWKNLSRWKMTIIFEAFLVIIQAYTSCKHPGKWEEIPFPWCHEPAFGTTLTFTSPAFCRSWSPSLHLKTFSHCLAPHKEVRPHRIFWRLCLSAPINVKVASKTIFRCDVTSDAFPPSNSGKWRFFFASPSQNIRILAVTIASCEVLTSQDVTRCALLHAWVLLRSFLDVHPASLTRTLKIRIPRIRCLPRCSAFSFFSIWTWPCYSHFRPVCMMGVRCWTFDLIFLEQHIPKLLTSSPPKKESPTKPPKLCYVWYILALNLPQSLNF